MAQQNMAQQNTSKQFCQQSCKQFYQQLGYGTTIVLSAVLLNVSYARQGLANAFSAEISPAEISPAAIFPTETSSALLIPLTPLTLDHTTDPPATEIYPSLLTQSENVPISTHDDPPKFGTSGTQRWYLQSGLAVDFDDDAVGLMGAGITHFVFDGHSVNLELNGMAFDQPGANAVGANLNFLVRSHWIRGENWSIYVDGGAGILQTTDGVPSVGSTFNFTPQVGGGATFAINDRQRLMAGLRWLHVSSADTFEPNPGLDTWFGYIGLNFPL